MDTHVTKTDESGKRFNKWSDEVIACSNGCGRDTTMTGTKLCDHCWEENRRNEQELQNAKQNAV